MDSIDWVRGIAALVIGIGSVVMIIRNRQRRDRA
jgi:hypothetical protein